MPVLLPQVTLQEPQLLHKDQAGAVCMIVNVGKQWFHNISHSKDIWCHENMKTSYSPNVKITRSDAGPREIPGEGSSCVLRCVQSFSSMNLFKSRKMGIHPGDF